jgi:hypothetical protein
VRARHLKTLLSALERSGAATVAAVRARAGAALLERIDAATPAEWLPIELDVALTEAIARELGPRRTHAHFRAATGLDYETSLFRGFVHMASNLFGLTPATYVKLLPKGWSLVFRECGEFRAGEPATGRLELAYHDVPRVCATELWLESVRSSFHSCFDLCGLAEGRVEWGELDLRGRRAVFVFAWGAAAGGR